MCAGPSISSVVDLYCGYFYDNIKELYYYISDVDKILKTNTIFVLCQLDNNKYLLIHELWSLKKHKQKYHMTLSDHIEPLIIELNECIPISWFRPRKILYFSEYQKTLCYR